jgi:hypothetical protein
MTKVSTHQPHLSIPPLSEFCDQVSSKTLQQNHWLCYQSLHFLIISLFHAKELNNWQLHKLRTLKQGKQHNLMEETKIHPLLLHNLLRTTMYHYRNPRVINDNSLLKSAWMSLSAQVLNVVPASPKTTPYKGQKPKRWPSFSASGGGD